MNVNKINYQNSTSFQSAHRVYNSKILTGLNPFRGDYVHTTTNLFREDLDWENFIKYINYHFADKNKINSYSLACSDGSEAYTYAIMIMEKLGKAAKLKFLPVKAADIDFETIDFAKSGRINIYGGEFKSNQRYGINLKNYFVNRKQSKQYTNDEVYLYINSSSYEVAPELKKNVEFKHSDILTELQSVEDDGNSIIMCRNVFPYLDEKYINNVVQTANEKLKQGSLFVIGNYDYNADMENRLLNNGFFRPLINVHNVFEKGTPDAMNKKLLMGYLI